MALTAAQAAELRSARELSRAGHPEQAETIYRNLHLAAPLEGEILLAWGQLRRALGDGPVAADLLQRAIAAQAGPPAQVEYAALLIDHGRLAPAEQLLRQALLRQPRLAPGHLQLARLEAARGRPELAADLYRAASRADPHLIAARLGLARSLAALGRLEEAAQAYTALLKRAPDHIEALLGYGWLLGKMHRFAQALDCFDAAERRGADVAHELAEVALGLAHICDWTRREELRRRLRARLSRPEPCVLDTYAVLAAEDDPPLHQRMGALLSAAVQRHVGDGPHPQRTPRPNGGRIRLGYLSSDFNQHATALLMAGIFARHDRTRFEVTAFSYSRDDASPMRRRVVQAFDRFEELALESPAKSAQRIAAAGIDVLIDLKGYTTGARPEIAALRPAPVQVSHLGYPATIGAGWFDYVIADPVVLPIAEQPHWHERIVHLPHSYQPNDRTRPTPPPPTRAAQGLPEAAFVFACFNNNYKITPEIFALWMAILSEHPPAVLWLQAANPHAERALRAAAARHGVASERLHFAPLVDLEAHLARHACADLFLDTMPYGAHTTGADALWTGLPIVTLAGQSFAARVAASLLHAVGLPELIATSAPQYQALALQLARDPGRLRRLRRYLLDARRTAPLFDAARYTSNLERAYAAMFERHQAGLPPEPFGITDDQPFHHAA
jgi:predicted O-linked N-acetylglucosamine transferase (SPINDLY family)